MSPLHSCSFPSPSSCPPGVAFLNSQQSERSVLERRTILCRHSVKWITIVCMSSKCTYLRICQGLRFLCRNLSLKFNTQQPSFLVLSGRLAEGMLGCIWFNIPKRETRFCLTSCSLSQVTLIKNQITEDWWWGSEKRRKPGRRTNHMPGWAACACDKADWGGVHFMEFIDENCSCPSTWSYLPRTGSVHLFCVSIYRSCRSRIKEYIAMD